MVKALKRAALAGLAVAAMTTGAAAQDPPASGKAPVTVALGYQFQRVGETNMAKGGFVDLSFGRSNVEGVVQAGASFTSSSYTSVFSLPGFSNSSEASLSFSRLVGGVRLRTPGVKATPYVHALGGLVRAGADGTSTASGPMGTRTSSFDTSDSEGAIQLGVGVDIAVSTKIGVRLGGDYMRVLTNGGGNVWLATAGLAFGLGGR